MHVIAHPSQLGQIIKARRKALHLTQRDLAAKLGIRQNRLSQLETDPGSLSVGRLVPLLNALGLELIAQNRGPSRAEW